MIFWGGFVVAGIWDAFLGPVVTGSWDEIVEPLG